MTKKIIKYISWAFVIVFVLSGCSKSTGLLETSFEQGNTNGNIHQMGYAVEKDGWIYYCNTDGNGEYIARGGLFRKRLDGTQKQKLNNSYNLAYQINVVGDFVYYIHGEPGPIYRINKDGGVAQELENRRSSNLIVLGKTVFYRCEYQYLYKMDADGNNKVKLKDNIVEFSIYENSIYFTDEIDGQKLYTMDFNGDNIRKLNDDYTKNINIGDGKIYYSNHSDYDKIYKMNLDGSEKNMICDDASWNVNLHEGVLYYRNHSLPTKDMGSLYKINVDGTDRSELVKGNIGNINIVKDFIVFRDINAGSKEPFNTFFKIDLNGNDREVWN